MQIVFENDDTGGSKQRTTHEILKRTFFVLLSLEEIFSKRNYCFAIVIRHVFFPKIGNSTSTDIRKYRWNRDRNYSNWTRNDP